MSEQLEEQLDTGSSESETVETEDDTTSDDSQDDSSSQEEKEKKNKSNWKKVSEQAKKAKVLEAELAKAQAELEAWRSENPDLIKEAISPNSTEKLEKKLFLIENPDAKEHLERIDAIVAKSKGGIDRDEAWELIKGSIPKESVSKTDFTTKSAPVNSKKKLADLSMEEAVKLDKASYAKWAEAQGLI